ncbi:MAG: four helix bundle protein, partial [Clostridia bacterium]|nr:four helix bundle protein [Clostridia bacterium]
KECYESEYWLELLNKTGFLPDEKYKPLKNLCGSLRRMLISSINTTKNNATV